jgi:hypothetical protein
MQARSEKATALIAPTGDSERGDRATAKSARASRRRRHRDRRDQYGRKAINAQSAASTDMGTRIDRGASCARRRGKCAAHRKNRAIDFHETGDS